MTGQSV